MRLEQERSRSCQASLGKIARRHTPFRGHTILEIWWQTTGRAVVCENLRVPARGGSPFCDACWSSRSLTSASRVADFIADKVRPQTAHLCRLFVCSYMRSGCFLWPSNCGAGDIGVGCTGRAYMVARTQNTELMLPTWKKNWERNKTGHSP